MKEYSGFEFEVEDSSVMIATAFEVAIEVKGGECKVYANSCGENVVSRPRQSDMEKVFQLQAGHPSWYFLEART